MINKLIKLANALDALGFKEEARMVGFLMEKKASPGWGSDYYGGKEVKVDVGAGVGVGVGVGVGRSIVFGDSQTGGDLGLAIAQKTGSTRYLINGASVGVWKSIVESDGFREVLAGADFIYITLGGNGEVSQDEATAFIDNIRDTNKDASITWFGPPPPAFDGYRHSYESKIKDRSRNNSNISNGISGKEDVEFVNLFDILKDGDRPGYYCNKKCDGIHLKQEQVSKVLEGVL